eukprot:1140747-Pelagomonas_calceolata.AAC.2
MTLRKQLYSPAGACSACFSHDPAFDLQRVYRQAGDDQPKTTASYHCKHIPVHKSLSLVTWHSCCKGYPALRTPEAPPGRSSVAQDSQAHNLRPSNHPHLKTSC